MKRLGRRAVLVSSGATLIAGACSRSRGEPEKAPARQALLQGNDGLLALPKGFTARVLQRSGERMTDGYRVPARPDAMACFPAADGSLVLMRNHEVTVGDFSGSPFWSDRPVPPEAYDVNGTGGVTRLVLDPKSLSVKSSNLVLAGTYWNCAGGTSPWGWLTCEETLEHGHGYVFLCKPDATRVQKPHRIDGYGRMRHEAATVDPKTHIAYLTEDQPDGAFYRFVPDQRGAPFAGRLQALRIVGAPAADTGPLTRGEVRVIDWVDLPNPQSEADDLRMQAAEAGAARFVRSEGLWLSDRDVFFSATNGGPAGLGQIWRLRIDQQKLELMAASSGEHELDMPDNLTVSPHGQVYIAEDGANGNRILLLQPNGELSVFAHNVSSSSEFAGLCFSPDGGTLFVNLQAPGLTLAIRGPFGDGFASLAPAPAALHAGFLPRSPVGIASGLFLLAITAAARTRRGRAGAG